MYLNADVKCFLSSTLLLSILFLSFQLSALNILFDSFSCHQLLLRDSGLFFLSMCLTSTYPSSLPFFISPSFSPSSPSRSSSLYFISFLSHSLSFFFTSLHFISLHLPFLSFFLRFPFQMDIWVSI